MGKPGTLNHNKELRTKNIELITSTNDNIIPVINMYKFTTAKNDQLTN